MSILKWLGLDKRAEQASGDEARTRSVREIVAALDALEPARARFVAGFAYLLGRVAHADLDISPEETAEMERIVQQVGGLPEEQAVVVVQMAKTHAALFGGTEDFLVSREFAESASPDQKLGLLRCLFAVAAADEDISTVENNTISQIADELKIDRDQVGALRASFKDFLGSLRSD
jgi:uncharacterized tellurite resistance protein B-like protein